MLVEEKAPECDHEPGQRYHQHEEEKTVMMACPVLEIGEHHDGDPAGTQGGKLRQDIRVTQEDADQADLLSRQIPGKDQGGGDEPDDHARVDEDGSRNGLSLDYAQWVKLLELGYKYGINFEGNCRQTFSAHKI